MPAQHDHPMPTGRSAPVVAAIVALALAGATALAACGSDAATASDLAVAIDFAASRPDGGAAPDLTVGADLACVGDGGCFSCPPARTSEFLNQCSGSTCARFDNRRLVLLDPDGGLPPL